MRFFFPDSQDQIDPSFDFETEERSILRVRQRDDLYAHEALAGRVIDGLLVSKGIVDGISGGAGRYSMAQRHRLYREGVRKFFRLDAAPGPAVKTMGDCGAFTYVREDTPPYSPDQVIDFYEDCQFDLGISVDHVILGFDPAADKDVGHAKIDMWRGRQLLTLELAAKFLTQCKARKVRFQPLGVAQGWSPESYAKAVRELQVMGYTRIAVGGMVPMKTPEILASLRAIADVRRSVTQLHLLGITRCSNVSTFTSLGVTSFDSTSSFRQAFKDDKDNYHTAKRTYTAIRVPQVDGNPKLKAKILAGEIRQENAMRREADCLSLLKRFDAGEVEAELVVEALRSYSALFDPHGRYYDAYRELLEDAPWKSCACGICGKAGINVAVFRGSERNKRRGFHNLYAFRQRLDNEIRSVA